MGNGAIRPLSEITKEERDSVFMGESPSLEAIAEYIMSGRANNIVCVIGAGASVSAGIPDFRTPGTGLYDNLEKYNLPTPESIFSLDFFRDNPIPFYTLAKEIYPGSHKPTPTHYFLLLLHQKGLLRRVYTQNIDGLERIAGLPEDKVVQCHGGFDSGHCIKCQGEVEGEWLKGAILEGRVPVLCPVCPPTDNRNKDEESENNDKTKAFVKPQITFFGEALNARFKKCCEEDLYCMRDGRSVEARERHAELEKQKSAMALRVRFGLATREEVATYQAVCDALEASMVAKKEALYESCNTDLMLVFGTSLQVAPVATLPDQVLWSCPRVLFNRDAVHTFNPEMDPEDFSNIVMGGDNGFRFHLDDNYRDVFCEGDCDAGVQKLTNLLQGWKITTVGEGEGEGD
jgi:NAD-dependent SIR2 family protein deacetylase